MGRPIRQLEPGRFWFVTIRCQETMFLLRPDSACVEAVGFWLARALARFTGVRVLAFVQMSNHLHAVVQDHGSELSEFMAYFLGNLARDVNGLRGRRGAFFERRFTARPILDMEAVADRIVYTVANPVQSSLVRTHGDWPGLLVLGGDAPRSFERTRGAAEKAELEPEPLPEGLSRDALLARIQVHEGEVFRRLGSWCLGRRRVLDQDPFDRPDRPKRTRAPLCHVSRLEGFFGFLEAWRALCDAYAAASRRWRRGELTTRFPPYTFKPPLFAGA